MRFKIIRSLLLLSILLLSCNKEFTDSGIVLSKTENGKEIIIPNNTFFKLQLSGNISTGCSWYVSTINNNYLSQKGESIYHDTATGKGIGGLFIFTFDATSHGKSGLELKYGRDFESQKSIVDSFSVTINVK